MARKTISEEEWAKIRNEYITTGISGRDLAEKYGAPEGTLFKRSKREQWEAKRKQHGCKLDAELMQRDIDCKVDSAVHLMRVTGMLLGKIETGITNTPIMSATAANNYASSLEKVKGILNIRSAEDLEEQKARIEKLRRESEKEDTSKTITVTLEGAMAEYGR